MATGKCLKEVKLTKFLQANFQRRGKFFAFLLAFFRKRGEYWRFFSTKKTNFKAKLIFEQRK